jgi:hypothetical protein
MFTHIQKVDRGLQASFVAAKILKQKWLAGLVPLEKTLASPPVTLLPWVPTWRGKAGGKARRQDAKKSPFVQGFGAVGLRHQIKERPSNRAVR